jgi:hypothetical protein
VPIAFQYALLAPVDLVVWKTYELQLHSGPPKTCKSYDVRALPVIVVAEFDRRHCRATNSWQKWERSLVENVLTRTIELRHWILILDENHSWERPRRKILSPDTCLVAGRVVRT